MRRQREVWRRAVLDAFMIVVIIAVAVFLSVLILQEATK
jgi:hypothetical protein